MKEQHVIYLAGFIQPESGQVAITFDKQFDTVAEARQFVLSLWHVHVHDTKQKPIRAIVRATLDVIETHKEVGEL